MANALRDETFSSTPCSTRTSPPPLLDASSPEIGSKTLCYGLEPHEKFASPIVQLLLNLEARRFATYLTSYDLWHLRQVSRQFRRWCLCRENEMLSLSRGFLKPGWSRRGLPRLGDGWRVECLTHQTSWSGFTVLLRNAGKAMRLPPEVQFPDGEWSVVNDELLEGYCTWLASVDHHPGSERYYSSTWRPPHDLKNLYLLKRNPTSSLTFMESIASLIRSVRGPSSLDVRVHQDLVYSCTRDPFPMFRQCLPYAAEPELHLMIFLVRAGLAHEPLRSIVFDVNSDLTPTSTIQLFKDINQTLLYAIEEEEEDFIDLVAEEEKIWPVPNLILSMQQYAQGVLALDPAHFWENLQDPLPELTESLQRKYIMLAQAYIDLLSFKVTIVPWFNVPNLVIKGATINHQLYLLESAGDYVRHQSILAPFSGISRSPSFAGKLLRPYDGLILQETLRRPRPSGACNGDNSNNDNIADGDFFVRVTLSTTDSSIGSHRGDIGAIYVGPYGAYYSSCRDDNISPQLAIAGIIKFEDCM